MSWAKKIFPVLLSLLILGIVVWQAEPPKSLQAASPFQVGIFFLPFLLLLTFLIKLFFKNLLESLSIGIGGTILLLLQGTNNLNFLSLVIIILITTFLVKILKKPSQSYQSKIPRLSRLSRQ